MLILTKTSRAEQRSTTARMAAPLRLAARFRALPGWRYRPFSRIGDHIRIQPHLKDRIVWPLSETAFSLRPARRDASRGRRNRGPRYPPRRALRHYQFGTEGCSWASPPSAAFRDYSASPANAAPRSTMTPVLLNDRTLKGLPLDAAAPTAQNSNPASFQFATILGCVAADKDSAFCAATSRS